MRVRRLAWGRHAHHPSYVPILGGVTVRREDYKRLPDRAVDLMVIQYNAHRSRPCILIGSFEENAPLGPQRTGRPSA